MSRRLKDKQGFTLLELLMVVIIIAILAAVALPQYLRVVERTRASEALNILSAMRSSELRYRDQSPDSNTFTSDPNELDIGVPCYNDPHDATGATQLPCSLIWTFSVNKLSAINSWNVQAKRNAPSPYADATIDIDITTGVECSTNQVYGVPTPAALDC